MQGSIIKAGYRFRKAQCDIVVYIHCRRRIHIHCKERSRFRLFFTLFPSFLLLLLGFFLLFQFLFLQFLPAYLRYNSQSICPGNQLIQSICIQITQAHPQCILLIKQRIFYPIVNRVVPPGCLLNDKSILFIEIQPFHQRQTVGRSRKIKREFFRSKTFRFHKTLRESFFLETAQQHIIRQEMGILSLYNRIYGQRVSPQGILAHTPFHGRDNNGVIKSYDLRRLGKFKILVGIH